MVKYLSIPVRMIAVMYLVTIGVSFTVGWIGRSIAVAEVEKRLVHDAASNLAAFVEQLRFVPGNRGMKNFGKISGGEVVLRLVGKQELRAASFSGDAFKTIEPLLANGLPDQVEVDSRQYRIGTARVRLHDHRSGEEEFELILFVPISAISEAEAAAKRKIAVGTGVAIVVATILAIVLSLTITRPLRNLTHELDELSKAENACETLSFRGEPDGPPEIRKLSESFSRLLSELKSAQDELARTERLAAIGKVAAAVTHELRNPLSGVKMHVRLLRDIVGDDEDGKESLRLVENEIDRMDLYFGELMALARGKDAGAMTLDRCPTDIRAQVDDVLQLLEQRLDHASVSVRKEIPDNLAPVNCDPTRIRQVLLNLIINASEAMSDGGVIEVSIKQNGGLRVEILDHGPGIEAGQNIFDAFVSSKYRGAGLGLYVCRQIIESHGGQIGYTRLDTGTCFWFELPGDDT